MAARKQREPDPMTQLRSLAGGLERDGLARGYVLRGDEPWFTGRAERLVRERAAADGCEVRVHDAKDPDFELARVIGDLSGGGLFASRTCVVLRNAGAPMKSAGGKDGALGLALLAFVKSPDDVGTVVLSADSLRADQAVVKAIRAADGVLFSSRRLWDSPPPWDPDPRKVEIVRWLLDRAREAKVDLDASRAVYVVAATGNDLSALEDQLVKLRHAGSKGLREVVGWEPQVSPFQIAEQLCRGSAGRALQGVEDLFKSGFREKDGSSLREAPGLVAILLASVTRLVRQGLAGSMALEAGADLEAAAAAAAVGGNPRAKAQFAELARARPARQWRAMLEELARLDRRSKTGGTVDVNDFALLASRWKLAPAGAGAR